MHLRLNRGTRTSRQAHGVPGSGSAGFTILELLVATSIFSIVLLVVTTGIMSFTRQYYKGVISASTQNTARAILSDVSQAIQFSSTVNTGLSNAGSSGFCVDGKLYSYVIGRQVTDDGGSASKHQGYHGIVISPVDGMCSAVSQPVAMPTGPSLPTGYRGLLANHMRLAALDVTSSSEDGTLYTIHVRVIYGDDDLLDPVPASAPTPDTWAKMRCNGGIGSQFCAVSDLTTTVQKRLQ